MSAKSLFSMSYAFAILSVSNEYFKQYLPELRLLLYASIWFGLCFQYTIQTFNVHSNYLFEKEEITSIVCVL